MDRKRLAACNKVGFVAMVGLVVSLAGAFVPGTSAAFSAASLNGAYGCVGQVTLYFNSSSDLQGISEVMRLGFDGAGNVKGKILLNLAGEVCNVATTGNYTVGGNGLGTINLTWVSATGDPDGDANCANINSAGIAQHMLFVIEGNGTRLDFESSDEFLTPSSSDNEDAPNQFMGACRTQS